MTKFFEAIQAFIKEPFVTPMSFWRYSALVGLTIMIVVLWIFVLREIERGVKEI